jgi:hypothetical protein
MPPLLVPWTETERAVAVHGKRAAAAGNRLTCDVGPRAGDGRAEVRCGSVTLENRFQRERKGRGRKVLNRVDDVLRVTAGRRRGVNAGLAVTNRHDRAALVDVQRLTGGGSTHRENRHTQERIDSLRPCGGRERSERQHCNNEDNLCS